MRFETKYRLVLHKRYFDHGYSMLGMIKYIFVGSILYDYFLGALITLLYGVACYIFGRFYYSKGWVEAEIEVGNRFNKFVKEMRETYTKS